MTNSPETVEALIERLEYRIRKAAGDQIIIEEDDGVALLTALATLQSENERLTKERDEARARATENHAETRAFWDALVPKGPRCRDCADFDGRCQGDGPPCAPQEHALENLAKLQSRALAAEAALPKAVADMKERAAKRIDQEADAFTGFPEERILRPLAAAIRALSEGE